MRIVSLALGTHGDVRPVVALGKALKARGADVCVVTGTDQIPLVERNGLDAASAGVDFSELLNSLNGFNVVESGNGPNFMTLTRNMKRLFKAHNPTLMAACYQASADADAIMSGFTSDIFAVPIAEKLGLPHISAQLAPAPVATRSGNAMAIAPRPGRESAVNYFFHKAMIEPFNWRLSHESVTAFRADVLGLPCQRRRAYQRRLERALIIQGFSSHVVPHPLDWPANLHTTGYWPLDDEDGWTPPQALVDFLDAGEPPVFIGFGSMTVRNVTEVTRLLIDAVQAAGRRAIIQAGWASLGAGTLPDSVHVVGPASHRWLFEQVAAVVHHGGSGTTAAGLRAGLPTVIIPHFGDQPFWGARVAALGAGPRPIAWPKLTPQRLAEAVRQAVGAPAMRENAAVLGAKIRAEDGIGTAVALIESYLARIVGTAVPFESSAG